MFKLPFVIMKRKDYDNLMLNDKNNKMAIDIQKNLVKKHMVSPQTFRISGRWTQYDPLPFDFALANLEKQFKAEMMEKIHPKVDISVRPDGITRDVLIHYEWIDKTERG